MLWGSSFVQAAEQLRKQLAEAEAAMKAADDGVCFCVYHVCVSGEV
jgi:hypothetical protein